MTGIALVTAEVGREIDPDLPLLEEALTSLGRTVDVVCWDDASVPWERYELAVVRSCWDYAWRLEEFLAWAARVPRLRNPLEVLRWNTDKRYVEDLARAGIPVVPTAWNPDARASLPEASEWVVKPSVSAGSRDTARWERPADVLAHVGQLRAAGRTAMVQPYLRAVDSEGETALLFAGGDFSHAVRKGPLLERGEGVRQDRDSREDLRPREATDEQLDLGRRVLDAARAIAGDSALYARVDVVTSEDGQPMLLELELTEPSLFLPQAPAAAGRLARAIDAEAVRAAPRGR